jgi:hypothetical protein
MRYFIFIFIPFISFSQDIINDTMYINKINNLYYVKKITFYNDLTTTENIQLLGDSVQAINIITNNAINYSDKIAEIARGYLWRNRINKIINFQNDLHVQISGKPVYFTTAQRDTAKFLGDWKLNFNGEIIDGVIELNNNKRLIFNPDNGKVYTISTNLLLATFTNQISFTFNGIKYDLYKYADGKFATVDGDVRLIKIE